ncbi:MAG TPA: hypothetical protein VIK91_10445 [Nannocystis sp.]
MSKSFTRDRCIPWLFSGNGVAVDGEPREVASDVDVLRARLPNPRAFRLSLAGGAGLFLAAILLMIASRPARSDGPARSSAPVATAGYVVGGTSIGLFALGRRASRNAPALAVLCAGREATLDDAALQGLAESARKSLVERSYPEGQIWLVTETPLSADRKARASELGMRCFAPVSGRIVEV